jgi:type VI secretion system protein ImpE
MTASELYQAGQLAEAIAAQVDEVRSHPADQSRRLFLFELLAFAGDLDRARKHLDALHFDEPELALATQRYHMVLDAEQARRKLFQGVPPGHLAEPSEHLKLRWLAVEALRHDRPAEAVELLDRATEAMPTITGHLNGTPFDEMRDIDDLFAGVLEVFSKNAYYWVPLELIQNVSMNAPKFPRDLLSIPARLTLRDGSTGEVFLPALYPGTHTHTDDAIKLGRLTDWNAVENGPVLGVGQHTYLVDEGDMGLIDWRMLELR